MTHFHYETLNCNYCCNDQDVVVWDVIDLAEDPDLKEKILLKELQNYECQNCNHRFILEKPLLYIDRSEKLILYYSPLHETTPELQERDEQGRLALDIRQALPKDLGFSIEGFSLRLVTTYNDLIEKIHIQDDGLLDRIVEVVKVAMETRIPDLLALNPVSAEDPTDPDTDSQTGAKKEEHLVEIHYLGQEAQKMLFQVLMSASGWQQIELESSVYQQAETMLLPFLPAEEDWDKVDKTSALLLTQYAGGQLQG